MRALILGITGQDGSYMAELLLDKGYEVHGLIRRSATGNTRNIDHILNEITLYWGDLTDTLSLQDAIVESLPDEIYNMADQDLASRSWDTPKYNMDVTGAAVGEILRIIKGTKIKFLQPISSHIFGRAGQYPQYEDSIHAPASPYACAKAMALNLCRMHRELGTFVSCPILYNHVSPRQNEDYLISKLIRSLRRIAKGEQKKVKFGDLSSPIDVGYAPEFVEAEWKILQQDEPGDFIIGTGQLTVPQDLVDYVLKKEGLTWDVIEIDKGLFRPTKNFLLRANYTKARETFGFEPKIKGQKLIDKFYEN